MTGIHNNRNNENIVNHYFNEHKINHNFQSKMSNPAYYLRNRLQKIVIGITNVA